MIVTHHARARFDERVGVGDVFGALERGVDLPAWLAAVVFRRGRPDLARYRFCAVPPCVLVLVADPWRVVTVYAPRKAQLVALRRHVARRAA